MKFLIKKNKPRKHLLGFLMLRMKLNKEIETDISKDFLKKYKNLNNKALKLSKKNRV